MQRGETRAGGGKRLQRRCAQKQSQRVIKYATLGSADALASAAKVTPRKPTFLGGGCIATPRHRTTGNPRACEGKSPRRSSQASGARNAGIAARLTRPSWRVRGVRLETGAPGRRYLPRQVNPRGVVLLSRYSPPRQNKIPCTREWSPK